MAGVYQPLRVRRGCGRPIGRRPASRGPDVWMAPGSIRPGESFAAAIDRGLEGCEYVAVLLSPAAMASAWVQAEVYAALDRAHPGG